MSKIDKFGVCPNCGKSWAGSDIYTELNSLDALTHRSPKDIKEMANSYGWKEDNKTNFSQAIVIQSGDKTLYQCPNIRCGRIFDSETGLGYDSIEEAKKGEIEEEPIKGVMFIAPNKQAYDSMVKELNQEDYE